MTSKTGRLIHPWFPQGFYNGVLQFMSIINLFHTVNYTPQTVLSSYFLETYIFKNGVCVCGTFVIEKKLYLPQKVISSPQVHDYIKHYINKCDLI